MSSSSTSDLPGRPISRLIRGAVLLAGLVGLGLVASFSIPALRTTMADSRSTPIPAPVDGDRAYGYLKQICQLGPHTAGSATNAKVRKLVADHFKKHGATVRDQPFKAREPLTGASLDMANLVGSWFPNRAERVVICAHYDTRPFPDEDTNPANRKKPFLGANDPGSGIALLMEMAHHLADSPTPWGVDLVLFDGEELVYGTGNDQAGEYFLGSKAFARAYAKTDRRKTHYAAGVLLDMVGSRDLTINREPYSVEFAPSLVRDVWSVAKALNVGQFRDEMGRAVYDDHLALNNAGIPAIDLIDFEYKYWHTADDLPERCSGASLALVGKVVTAWLNKPKIPER